MLTCRFQPGDIVVHFKRTLLENAQPNDYVYRIICIAMHTETNEPFMIYQAMYGNRQIYARPLEIFLEEVPRNKYPDCKQKYRFEKIG